MVHEQKFLQKKNNFRKNLLNWRNYDTDYKKILSKNPKN